MEADGEQKRKRKRENDGTKKLLPGEEIEVLYSEEGLKGSWHLGVVIDCGRRSRTIELADLLNEDNSKLVHSIPVSAAIEGLTRITPKVRNWIRPLPPKYKINATEIRYGLCVDAFVSDAWWEGVVFDHNEGSADRLIFFPDQGDQQTVSFEKLRITQEWNEASGEWKNRGEWLFLQVLQTIEQEGALPVSIREIWYDLRGMPSFSRKLVAWTSGSKLIWHKLVVELIQELFSVVNGQSAEVSISDNELHKNPVNFDADISMEFLRSSDGNQFQADDGQMSPAVTANNFPAVLYPDDHSSVHNPAYAKHATWSFFNEGSQIQDSREVISGEHVVILSSVNESNKIQDPSPHAKQCTYGLKLCASLDGMHCDSHGNVHGGCQEMARTKGVNSGYICNNLAGKKGVHSASPITALQSSETWKLMELEAENCAEAIFFYLYDLEDGVCSLKRPSSRCKKIGSLRLKAKKHLVALGWKIEAKSYHGSSLVRFVSPEGQCYYSLRKACFGLLRMQLERTGMEDCNHFIELLATNRDTKTRCNFQRKCRMPSGMKESNDMSNSGVTKDDSSCVLTDERLTNSGCSSERGGSVSKVSTKELYRHKDIEPGNFPEAVNQYIDYMNSIRGINTKKQTVTDSNLIRLNAKRHLIFMGWKLVKTKFESYYISAIGKPFRSLYSACNAFLEKKKWVGISRSLLNGKSRRRLEYLPSEMVHVDIEKKLLRRLCRYATTTTDENFQEILKVLENGAEKGYTDSSKFTESTTSSFSEIPSSKHKGSRKRRLTSFSTYQSSACAKSEKRKTLFEKRKTLSAPVRKRHSLASSSSRRVRQSSSKRSREVDVLSPRQQFSGTILSLLIENDVLLPRQKVMYICKKDGHIMMEGRITRDGIKCKCCSKVYTLSNFEAHAGSTPRRPAANIYLKDGRSLLQCQMQMLSLKIPMGFQRSRLKSDCSIYQSDSICSVCHDGGSLVLCDHCPSSFHLECVGLEEVPGEKWFCSSCRCHICGMSEFNPDIEQFTEKTVLYCDQCEHEYHVGCMRQRGWKTLQSCPPGNWFCSRSCAKIFLDLRKLIGVSRPTSVEGLSFTILRSGRDYSVGCDQFDPEVLAEHHSKLCVALKVLHECFVKIVEPRTESDLVADILFNKESELKRLNFYGFYTILLERDDELISVATFRVYGEKIAEMPLVGTRIKYRRQGMCRLLVSELEKLLGSLGVERLLLPAVPQLLEAWTTSFGFSKMNNSDRFNLLDYTILNFQDTTMCQKLLRVAPVAHTKPRDSFEGNANTIGSDIHRQALLGPVLALPCSAGNSRPVLTESVTYKQMLHQTLNAQCKQSSNFVEPLLQAMWNGTNQTTTESVINHLSSL